MRACACVYGAQRFKGVRLMVLQALIKQSGSQACLRWLGLRRRFRRQSRNVRSDARLQGPLRTPESRHPVPPSLPPHPPSLPPAACDSLLLPPRSDFAKPGHEARGITYLIPIQEASHGAKLLYHDVARNRKIWEVTNVQRNVLETIVRSH